MHNNYLIDEKTFASIEAKRLIPEFINQAVRDWRRVHPGSTELPWSCYHTKKIYNGYKWRCADCCLTFKD